MLLSYPYSIYHIVLIVLPLLYIDIISFRAIFMVISITISKVVTLKIICIKFISVLCLLTSLLFSYSALSKQINDKLQLSGFARIVAGYLDDSSASYIGYENSFNLAEQSLIAFQADYQISNDFSITSQAIGSTGSTRDSGIEWLYLTYEPNRFSQIKIGKQRTPFFNYSDVIDVGFAYAWVTLPQQVYNSLFFSTFDGVLGSYEWGLGETIINLEAFGGKFDGDVSSSAGVDISADVDNIRGVIFNLTYDNFNFRSAYHRANAAIEINELTELTNTLVQTGFIEGAESLNTDGDIEFFQLGFSYESLDFFLRGEVTRNKAESNVVPDVNSFYVALGYNFFPYTTYISYAQADTSTDIPANFIPLGVNDDLNRLSIGYEFVAEQLRSNDSSSISLGTRIDWKSNLALKAEITWTRIDNNSSEESLGLRNEFTPLYQLAVEWVF